MQCELQQNLRVRFNLYRHHQSFTIAFCQQNTRNRQKLVIDLSYMVRLIIMLI